MYDASAGLEADTGIGEKPKDQDIGNQEVGQPTELAGDRPGRGELNLAVGGTETRQDIDLAAGLNRSP